MVGGLVYGWQNVNELAVLILLTLVAFGYGLMCLYTSQDLSTQDSQSFDRFVLSVDECCVCWCVSTERRKSGEEDRCNSHSKYVLIKIFFV